VQPWFQQNPARLEYELALLQDAGIPYAIDEAARQAGKLHLQVWPIIDNKETELRVEFPDLYPYFRFEVRAPTLNLTRHQHPFDKNLCLLPGQTEQWQVTDTVVGMLTTQLPKLLASLHDPSLEVEQGEPVTIYLPYQEDSVVLVDSDWHLQTDENRGQLLIGTEQPLVTQQGINTIRGAVLEITDKNGDVVDSADQRFATAYPHRISGQWYRIDSLPIHRDPEEIIASVRRTFPSIDHRWETINSVRISVIAIVFLEELQWQKTGWGWLFIVRVQRKHERSHCTYSARVGRAGKIDLLRRTPEVASLSTKRIAMAGVGCIGAPSALHLARASIGELRLMDHDHVEPGTIVRWPIGLQATGRTKIAALLQFLGTNYPYTNAFGWAHRLGDPNGADLQLLTEFLSGADLAYDATAEEGINHVLSDLARDRNIPYICISTTSGGWGGRIIRVRQEPHKAAGCAHSITSTMAPFRLRPHPTSLCNRKAAQPQPLQEQVLTLKKSPWPACVSPQAHFPRSTRILTGMSPSYACARMMGRRSRLAGPRTRSIVTLHAATTKAKRGFHAAHSNAF
jgi:molybdopterin/thiamine biosynthesis adenylyltransferase